MEAPSKRSGMSAPLHQREMALRMAGASMGGAPAPVTYSLIGICIAVFLLQLGSSFATGTDYLVHYGGYIPFAAITEPWRIFTSAFLHTGFMHVAFNMIALYAFGQILEPVVGSLRFAGIYLGSIAFGALGPVVTGFLFPSDLVTVSIGASGAVFGLFGAMFIVQRRVGASTLPLVILLGINFAYALFDHSIAWQAHLGGLIGGAIILGIYMLAARKPRPRTTQRVIDSGIMIGVALAVVALIMVLVYIMVGVVPLR